MKKLYTLIALAAATLAASAQDVTLTPSDIVTLPLTIEKTQQRAPQAALRAPEAGWGETETCSVVDGVLDKYYWDDSDGYDTYKADFQRNTATPGWIRVMIFNKHSKAAYGMFNAVNDNWLNIYLYNPDKVYAERCDFFGDGTDDNPGCVTYQKVPEDGWDGTAVYGTFKDNVISWPAKAFVTQWGSKFVDTNLKGKFQISLPGGAVTDYSLALDVPVCRADNKYPFTISRGQSVASYKYLLTQGVIVNPAPYADAIAQQGKALAVSTQAINLDASDASVYRDGPFTLLLAGLDAQGAVQSTAAAHCYVTHDVAAEWESIGDATMTEGIYGPIYYGSAYNASTLTCEVQRSRTNPALYRLVDPYKGMPHYFDNGQDMTSFCTDTPAHYMVIDTSDPQHVRVRGSRLGIDFAGVGEGAVWSPADRYLEAGYTPDECVANKVTFGTRADNVITFPEDALYLAEPQIGKGQIYPAGTNVVVTLPASEGIDDIETAIAQGPAAYYNLQGQPLTQPIAGQPCIVVTNGRAAKRLCR